MSSVPYWHDEARSGVGLGSGRRCAGSFAFFDTKNAARGASLSLRGLTDGSREERQQAGSGYMI